MLLEGTENAAWCHSLSPSLPLSTDLHLMHCESISYRTLICELNEF